MYAMIKNGLVDGYIDTTAEHAAEITAAGEHACIECATRHENGSAYDFETGVFTAPPDPPDPPEPPKYISVGAFFDRFGAQKYPILASADATVKALIADASVRKYIDLDRADLPAGLTMLVAAGYAIDESAILNAPVLPSELP